MRTKKQMEEKEQAIEFFQSMRGNFIIGQALYIAAEAMKKEPPMKREESNISDMEYLMDELFPIYKSIHGGGVNVKL